MTRGRIAAILPDGRFVTSVEFNGDMYYAGGYGEEVFDALEDMESERDYRDFVEQFNAKHFGYTDRELFFDCDEEHFDMADDYFGNWFSDYIYVKNLSEKPVVFTDAKRRQLVLEPDAAMAFYFGEFYADNAEDFEKREFIEQLGILKEGLGLDMDTNYSNLWNACAEYDNNHRGSYLTDRIQEYDFVDDEVLEYIVKEQSLGGISRLRCFIGDTYDANLYRLDGYGNLANVDNSDFEYLIDDIVQSLEEEIIPPLARQEICL